MSANVESMFYVREMPWHKLGTNVEYALNSKEALRESGLNWNVVQKPIITNDNIPVEGYVANVRSRDKKILGVVTDKYKVVQNHEAFAFTDSLLGNGVKYETAGSLQEGKKVWLLARLEESYKVLDDEVSPYLLFSNSHDGTGCVKICLTPIRVVCNNTLNLALSQAKRIWSATHTGNIKNRLEEARKTLLLAEDYMINLSSEAEELNKIFIPDYRITEYIDMLIPMPDNATNIQIKNVNRLKDDIKIRYFDAPDLQHVNKNAWRFLNAISDFATHAEPLRKTSSYRENLFAKTVEGNPLIDRAYDIIKSAA